MVSRALQNLDDRVLGPRGSGHAAWREVLRVVVAISRLVFLLLAALLLLAIALVVLPANENNTIVSHVLDAAFRVAGPFRTVFDVANRSVRAAANYGLAAGVYALIAYLLGRVPRAKK